MSKHRLARSSNLSSTFIKAMAVAAVVFWAPAALVAGQPSSSGEMSGSATRELRETTLHDTTWMPQQDLSDSDRGMPFLGPKAVAPGQLMGGIIPKNNGLELEGFVSASWGSQGVRMLVDRIANHRSNGTSGTLRLELWATNTLPIFGQTISAYTLGSFNLSPLSAGFGYPNVDTGFVPYTAPPTGCYYITIALKEFDSGTFFYQDLITLTSGGVDDGSGFDLFSFGGASCSSIAACTRSASTACLQNGRFEVSVSYSTASASGLGQVMSFGGQRAENSESVFYSFFSSTNFEMGLKIINACSFNNKFWVFISGLTDQGWSVHIRDSQTGATRTYSNALGHLSSTTADTSALPCP